MSREIAFILTLWLCRQTYQFSLKFPFCRQPLAVPPISHQIKGIEGGFYEGSLPEKVGTFSCGIPTPSAKSHFSLKYHPTQRCSCLLLSGQGAGGQDWESKARGLSARCRRLALLCQVSMLCCVTHTKVLEQQSTVIKAHQLEKAVGIFPQLLQNS